MISQRLAVVSEYTDNRAQERDWSWGHWGPFGAQAAKPARRADTEAGRHAGASEKSFGEISLTRPPRHFTHCLVYDPLHTVLLFIKRTSVRHLRKARIKSTYHKFLLLETNSWKTFLRYRLSNAWGFHEMPRPGSHKLSGGTGGLTEKEECWSSVFTMNWWKSLYLKHWSYYLPVNRLSNAKCKQRNKTESSLSRFPSAGPGPGLPCRAPLPPALLASFCHRC